MSRAPSGVGRRPTPPARPHRCVGAARRPRRFDVLVLEDRTLLAGPNLTPIETQLPALLGDLQAAVDSQVFDVSVPLLGKQLQTAAASQVLSTLQSEVAPLLAGLGANPTDTQIKAALQNAFGSLIQGAIGETNTATQTEFEVKLHQAPTASVAPLNFDAGFPGLGLKATGSVALKVNYDFDLKFGVDSTLGGFFFDTTPADQLSVGVSATLQGAALTARLGFLSGTATDNGSNVNGTFAVAFQPSGLLTPAQFAAITPSATLTGSAKVDLLLSANFAGASWFPTLSTEFVLTQNFNAADTKAPLFGDEPTVQFKNVQLDMGTFFSNFLDPLLKEVKDVTAPFAPVIKVLNERLPVISDLLNKIGQPDVTLLTLAQTFGHVDTAPIQALAQIINLANSVPTDASGLKINLGSFDLSGTDVRTATDLTGATPNPTGPAPADVKTQLDNAGHASDADFISNVEGLAGGGFSFPILDNPLNVFNLFLGKDVPLVAYELPDLNLMFHYHQFFPIVGPLGANFDGTITANTHIGFGYDTQGLKEFAADQKPADLIDGFFISNRQNADGTGPVVPALTLSGTIAAGAELNAIVVDFSLDAGLQATVDFNLNDPSNTGKIRFNQVTLAGLFCVMGELDAVLFATFKVGVDIPFVGFVGYSQDFNLGDFKLLDFGSTCNTNAAIPAPPDLGDVDGSGTLTLNMGPNAGKRMTGDTTDGDEPFTVSHVSGSPSDPGGETVEIDAFGYTETRSGVKQIYAEGGAGNNTITIKPGVLAPATLWGAFNPATNPGQENNFGNNNLTAGDGPTTLYGGGGNDTLHAGAGDDNLYGGGGNDVLIGGPGHDLLDGGGGNDQLTAGTGDSTLLGGAGDDALQAGAGTDVLDGGDDNDTLTSGTGNATMTGGTGNDVFIIANPAPGSHLPAQTLTVHGGGQPGDFALISGNNTEAAVFSPDKAAQGSGTATLTDTPGDTLTVAFDTLASVTAGNTASLKYLTPNKANALTVNPLLPGQSPIAVQLPNGQNPPIPGQVPASAILPNQSLITGTSGPVGSQVGLVAFSVHDVPNVTVDTTVNNKDYAFGDSFTVNNPGGPALTAAGLQNFTINSGAGNDALTINANDLRLPVAGGKFTFNAGTGTYPDGTPASNLRGLISLDRVVVNANEDMTLADLPHTFANGTPIPDDTPPGANLVMAAPGAGSDLGTLNTFGVEAAMLTGGPATTKIDASGFSGATVLRSGGGTTTLSGGSGDNVIYGGAGTDTLNGGNARADGHAHDLIGGGGTNVLIGGSGTETFNAGSGGTTMIGGAGSNTFNIANPAGTVFAPIGGYDVIGGSGTTNVLNLSGGGGAGFTEVYNIGTFPATPQAIYTLTSLGLDVPTLLTTVQFNGEITTANSFAASGTAQPVNQSVWVAGLSRINDSVAAKALSAFATPGAQPISATGSNLAGGSLKLSSGGGAFTPVTFSNKTAVGVYGAGGKILDQFPLPPAPAAVKPLAPASPVQPAKVVTTAKPVVVAVPVKTAARKAPAVSAPAKKTPAGPAAAFPAAKVSVKTAPKPAPKVTSAPHK